MSTSDNPRLPTFFIIGAPRAGTSSLHYYLSKHPQVFMSTPKEPMFFALEGEPLTFFDPKHWLRRHTITDWEAYLQLFRPAKPHHTVLGEASTLYLPIPRTAERIAQRIPNAKLIAILRQPVERAFSHFMKNLRDGREPCRDFIRAFQMDNERTAQRWAYGLRYKSLGYYAAQLKRYLAHFPREQLLILLYEDYLTSPEKTLATICRFLGLQPNAFPFRERKLNIGGIPRWQAAYRALTKASRTVARLPGGDRVIPLLDHLQQHNLTRPSLDAETRQRLTTEAYKDDILELQEILQRDLSHWLE